MVLLLGIGLLIKGWPFLWACPLSIAIWATAVDSCLGLLLHGNFFYLGNSWPDNLIKMPGKMYFAMKVVAIIFFSGFLHYIR